MRLVGNETEVGGGDNGHKWGGTMGTNGSQAAARGAAFNLIVLRSSRDLEQWLSNLQSIFSHLPFIIFSKIHYFSYP